VRLSRDEVLLVMSLCAALALDFTCKTSHVCVLECHVLCVCVVLCIVCIRTDKR